MFKIFLDSFDHFTMISLLVAPSTSNPGEEFTSNNKGPLEERMISTSYFNPWL
jgi:hypothetical protein